MDTKLDNKELQRMERNKTVNMLSHAGRKFKISFELSSIVWEQTASCEISN